MTARFAEVYTPELRKAAEARGMSTREVLTMASLIEKETAKSDERFLVSAVYHNRLKIGMGMQCDPTVIYALQKAGRYTGNLTRADLQFDSPYNTYRYSGLPPGPDRRAGPPRARSGGEARRCAVSVFREQERRLARVRGDARGAQSERAGVSGPLLPQPAPAEKRRRGRGATSGTRRSAAASPI